MTATNSQPPMCGVEPGWNRPAVTVASSAPKTPPALGKCPALRRSARRPISRGGHDGYLEVSSRRVGQPRWPPAERDGGERAVMVRDPREARGFAERCLWRCGAILSCTP